MNASARNLGDATDNLNEKLLQAARALAGLKLGVRAEVQVANYGALVFGKLDNAWQLIWVKDGLELPLTSAPRHIRIEATHALGPLLDQMLAQVDAELRQVHEAWERARQFCDRVASLHRPDTA